MRWLDAKAIKRRLFGVDSVAHAQWLIDEGHLPSRRGKVREDVLQRKAEEWRTLRGSGVPRIGYGVRQHMLNCEDKYGRLLSVEQAAEIARVGVATVWRRIKDGTIETVAFGEAEAAAFVRIPESNLHAAMPLARKRGRKPKAPGSR